MGLQRSILRVVPRPLGTDECSPAALIGPNEGAIASFLGVVRDHHHGKGVTSLRYECYEAMAVHQLEKIAAAVGAEAGDAELVVAVWHGFGEMVPGQVSLAVHCASPHRVAAFDACRAVVEAIKADLPIWKEERYDDGSARWLKGS